MKVLVVALVRAFSVIVKTDGSFSALASTPSQPQVCNIVPPRAGHWPPDTAPLTDYTAHTLPHQSLDIFITLQRSYGADPGAGQS